MGLLMVYGVTMGTLSGIDAAIEQFLALWYLMLPLAIGFGIQVALFTKLRERMNGVVASGGTSATVGMLACCAHHAADVLPIIGLSAAATLIGQYQKPILIVSILINTIGIGILWRRAQK